MGQHPEILSAQEYQNEVRPLALAWSSHPYDFVPLCEVCQNLALFVEVFVFSSQNKRN
jgi:hypothetical protein